mgnify:CR=1 FL=1
MKTKTVKTLKSILGVSLLFLFPIYSFGQNSCIEGGFETGSIQSSWSGGIGPIGSPFGNSQFGITVANASINDGQAEHTIISDPNYIDLNLCGDGSVFSNGLLSDTTGDFIVRLGNDVPSAEKQRMVFEKVVSASSSSLSYQFIWVYELPSSHTQTDAPRLEIFFTDANGTPLSLSCGEFSYSSLDMPGTSYNVTCGNFSQTKWIRETVDLSPFIGQTVYLNVVNSQCALGGHTSYVYFDAGCPFFLNESSLDCPSGDFELFATPNASAYQWYGPNDPNLLISGATNHNLIVNRHSAGHQYRVELTMPNNCDYSETKIVAYDQIVVDSILTTPSCPGLSDGTVQVFASLNSSPLTYQFEQGTPNSSGESAHSIGPGTWDLTITPTDTDCLSKDTVYLIPTDSITLLGIATENSCDLTANGRVEVEAHLETKPIQYDFTNSGTSNNYGTDSMLVQGSYSLVIISSAPECGSKTVPFSIDEKRTQFAGTSNTVEACLNEPLYLVPLLLDDPDTTGQFYITSWNHVNNNRLIIGDLGQAGERNFYYVVTDSLCGKDTSYLTINVSDECDFLSIEDLALLDIDVYPIPANETLGVRTSKALTNFEFIDLQGKLIKARIVSQTEQNVELDLVDLETGVYFLKFNEGKETLRVKILVQH